jgi:flagellar hook-length control protein FliK
LAQGLLYLESMAPIAAIPSQTINKPVSKADVQSSDSLRDEFSALFEDFIPGFEAESGPEAQIDTSITVAPMQVAQSQPLVQIQDGNEDLPEQDSAEIAPDSDRGANHDNSTLEAKSNEVPDDSEAGATVEAENVESTTTAESEAAQQLISQAGEASVEPEDKLVAKIADQLVQGEVAVDTAAQSKSDKQAVSEADLKSQAVSSSTDVDDVVEEDYNLPAANASVERKVELRKFTEKNEASESSSTAVNDLTTARPVARQAQTDEVVKTKVENPVFGSMKSDADEVSRLVTAGSDSNSGQSSTEFDRPRNSGNSPLLEVLMNQVQRLTTQNLSLGTNANDLNLGSKSTIQLGQSSVVAGVGANLLVRSESDPRSAKISRQLPAAGVKTMERVQKALADAVAAQDGKTISLRLDPPELGQVKVDLSFRGGNLSARIVAESAGVTAMLRERAHELQHTLRKLGIEANNVTVSVGLDNEQGGESKTNFNEERQREGQFESSYLEEEIVEGLVAEEEMQSGKVSVDHRVA